MESRPYYEQVDRDNVIKLRELISTLPPYVRTFFRGIEPNTSSLLQLNLFLSNHSTSPRATNLIQAILFL